MGACRHHLSCLLVFLYISSTVKLGAWLGLSKGQNTLYVGMGSIRRYSYQGVQIGVAMMDLRVLSAIFEFLSRSDRAFCQASLFECFLPHICIRRLLVSARLWPHKISHDSFMSTRYLEAIYKPLWVPVLTCWTKKQKRERILLPLPLFLFSWHQQKKMRGSIFYLLLLITPLFQFFMSGLVLIFWTQNSTCNEYESQQCA